MEEFVNTGIRTQCFGKGRSVDTPSQKNSIPSISTNHSSANTITINIIEYDKNTLSSLFLSNPVTQYNYPR